MVCSEGSCPVPQSLCRHKNTVLTLLQFLRFFFLIQCFFFFFWPSLPVTLGLEMPSPFLISDHLLLFLPLMLSHTAFLIVWPCSIYTVHGHDVLNSCSLYSGVWSSFSTAYITALVSSGDISENKLFWPLLKTHAQ